MVERPRRQLRAGITSPREEDPRDPDLLTPITRLVDPLVVRAAGSLHDDDGTLYALTAREALDGLTGGYAVASLWQASGHVPTLVATAYGPVTDYGEGESDPGALELGVGTSVWQMPGVCVWRENRVVMDFEDGSWLEVVPLIGPVRVDVGDAQTPLAIRLRSAFDLLDEITAHAWTFAACDRSRETATVLAAHSEWHEGRE